MYRLYYAGRAKSVLPICMKCTKQEKKNNGPNWAWSLFTLCIVTFTLTIPIYIYTHAKPIFYTLFLVYRFSQIFSISVKKFRILKKKREKHQNALQVYCVVDFLIQRSIHNDIYVRRWFYNIYEICKYGIVRPPTCHRHSLLQFIHTYFLFIDAN